MKQCDYCGVNLDDNVKICPNCGCPQKDGFVNLNKNKTNYNRQQANFGYGPVAGDYQQSDYDPNKDNGYNLNNYGNPNSVKDEPSIILNIIAFLFPLIALVLMLYYWDKSEVKVKSMGKWLLIGILVKIVASILSFMTIVLTIFSRLN